MNFTVWAYGLGKGNPAPGGWCTIVEPENGEQTLLKGRVLRTTSMMMEFQSIFAGIEQVRTLSPQEERQIVIHSNSGTICDMVNRGLLAEWQKRGWLVPDSPHVRDVELWLRLETFLREDAVSFNFLSE